MDLPTRDELERVWKAMEKLGRRVVELEHRLGSGEPTLTIPPVNWDKVRRELDEPNPSLRRRPRNPSAHGSCERAPS